MTLSLRQELYNTIQTYAYQYRTEPFTLASGRQSHHYFNCKKITLVPERLSVLCRLLRDHILKTPPAAAGGLTLGADPIAYGLSLAYLEKGIRMMPVVVRKEPKDHGTASQIEADFDSGRIDEILVLDDVITTAGSTLKAVRAIRQAGFKVRLAVCIIDREEGGRQALKEEGLDLISVFKKSDFLQEGHQKD